LGAWIEPGLRQKSRGALSGEQQIPRRGAPRNDKGLSGGMNGRSAL